MGEFYYSICIKSEESEPARTILESLAANGETMFYLAPPQNGWINVYPSISGLAEPTVKKLSSELDAHALLLVVHDGDVFLYEYYRSGQLADRYSSVPDYFGPVSKRERAALRGRAESFTPLISQADVDKLTAILSKQWELKSAESRMQGMEPTESFLLMIDGVPDRFDARRDGELAGNCECFDELRVS
jgi:hypothetical protein